MEEILKLQRKMDDALRIYETASATNIVGLEPEVRAKIDIQTQMAWNRYYAIKQQYDNAINQAARELEKC